MINPNHPNLILRARAYFMSAILLLMSSGLLYKIYSPTAETLTQQWRIFEARNDKLKEIESNYKDTQKKIEKIVSQLPPQIQANTDAQEQLKHDIESARTTIDQSSCALQSPIATENIRTQTQTDYKTSISLRGDKKTCLQTTLKLGEKLISSSSQISLQMLPNNQIEIKIILTNTGIDL